MGKPSRKQKNPYRQHGRWPDPHTPAWYAQMLRVHPPAAFVAQAQTERTGRVDGCSVCGDTPAPIYDAVDAPHHSIRLCGDCLRIREAFHDERFRHRSQRE